MDNGESSFKYTDNNRANSEVSNAILKPDTQSNNQILSSMGQVNSSYSPNKINSSQKFQIPTHLPVTSDSVGSVFLPHDTTLSQTPSPAPNWPIIQNKIEDLNM